MPTTGSSPRLRSVALAHPGESQPTLARFRMIVQSPLRASLTRYLHASPQTSFDADALMQALGHLRPDVERCLHDLCGADLVRQEPGATGHRYRAYRPDDIEMVRCLDAFLAERVAEREDQSPAVRRFRETLGRDEKMLVAFEWIRTAAKSDISVLVLGPTGSGKEVVARMIHELGPRASGRFQAVNCAALPDTLFESEIFGYEKGAFTGAHDRKPGRLEMADAGTFFLDEIGDTSLMAQAKLLRVLEERRFERLGGHKSIEVDFRLISATNRPLEQLVRDGAFREDLFYRVNAFAIRLPSLRERQVDIPILAERFLARYCVAHGLAADAKVFDRSALESLRHYSWPGNIRELESTVSRAALSSSETVIAATHLQFLHGATAAGTSGREGLATLADLERAHIARVLSAVEWNKKEAARILDISRGTLYRKIADYQLDATDEASHHLR